MTKFDYTNEQLKEVCQTILQLSKQKNGVSDACVSISEDNSLSVDVRQQNIETLEQSQSKAISLTIYKNQKVGHASSSDFSLVSLQNIVDAAYNIATYTSEDVYAGLPNQEDLAEEFFDCNLYNPWSIDADETIKLAIEMEHAVYDNKNIVNSDGCGVSTSNGHFMLANTLGFMDGYAHSSHQLWANAIAGKKNDSNSMQSESWSSYKRCPQLLQNHKEIATIAASKASSKLNAKKLTTRTCPVIFEAPIAGGLIRAILSALSGSNQYQKNSFLLDSIGKQILPSYLTLHEDPFVLKGLASSAFDEDGVKTHAKNIINDGIIETYLLSTYTARKLKLPVTGHAGGSHNLYLKHNNPNNSDNNASFCIDLNTLMKKMGNGLLITDTMGQGLNIITGDYSKGASGFWIENGVIAYAVDEITIAGNMKTMLQNIVAIAADEYHGSLTTGSILLEQMTIAGI